MAGLAAELKGVFGDIELASVESTGGVFEVTIEGRLVFSKKALGRFPAYQEVPTLIQMG